MNYQDLVGKRSRALMDIRIVVNSKSNTSEKKVERIKEILDEIETLEKEWEENVLKTIESDN
ncbi:hypothetical protein [uncultured Clostridium sp.]|uniref:hypothetical protein n=1 Tax=uncultured Clostridium sp. TaxID=59620 RepID=UPI0025E178E3|nr:hypothetical protein [uncultured Clostridium sp.]